MGGISKGKAEILNNNNKSFLRLAGNVSTENNGGFIQVRTSKEIFTDKFKGIKLKVKGNLVSITFISVQVFSYCHGNIIQENFLLIINGDTSTFTSRILKSPISTNRQNLHLLILKV